MWIAAFPFDFSLPRLCSTSMQRHWNGSFITTISFQTSFTTLTMVGKPSAECEIALQKMLHICKQLGIPIAERKIEGPTTVITFLGILLGTVKMELHLPYDKSEALTSLLRQWSTTKKKATKREILSLIGKLSFAAKVIPAGRIFLRRLIDLSTSVKSSTTI